MHRAVVPRQAPDSTKEFLDLLADPFQSQIATQATYAALAYALLFAAVLFLGFCLLRPRVPTVYAPRAKYADAKHAPPTLTKGLLGWVPAVKHVDESELVVKVGLDAVIFLRFTRMLRNIFLAVTVVGLLVVIPTVTSGTHSYDQWKSVANLLRITPQYTFGEKFWAYVFVAYLLQAIVCGFVFWNYRKVLNLKRTYFMSDDYQKSLHSRTILITHVPEASRTDSGLAQLIEKAKPTDETPRASIGRNVKELPELVRRHDEAVEKVEEVLAKYLRDPNRLPSTRPTCKVYKDDRSQHGKDKVDAIDYLTQRIMRLSNEIQQARESIDQRNPMPYGFASFTHIENAHAVAYASRKKGPNGSSILLAPKPNDLLWQNLAVKRRTRRRRRILDTLWLVLLTLVFVAPNILTAVFLSNLSNLGKVWPTFQVELVRNPTTWAIVQGILAPLIQTLIYMALPALFRRIYTHSGDESKTRRDRHVCSRLFAFYLFNNLVVFSVFASVWQFIAKVIKEKDSGVWNAILKAEFFSTTMIGLSNMSTFWLNWQVQRNLIAAADLLQLWTLLWGGIRRKWMSPTPREMIKLTAPQPFDYPVYYHNFLFVAALGLCIGVIQPVILPVTAFYLGIEYWWKKYLLQYVFITKTESGGQFWVMVVNRLLFVTVLANAVIALLVGARGVGNVQPAMHGTMLYAMIPLPFLMGFFKWYCVKNFDHRIEFYATNVGSDGEGQIGEVTSKKRRTERVAVRFGHPALYRKLITPMVHAKAQHRLRQVYHGNLDHVDNPADAGFPNKPSTATFGDVYMAEMDRDAPGQPSGGQLPFETVNEDEMDFQHFMRRAEFRAEFGGDGELYGRMDDQWSGTGAPTISTFDTRGDYGSPRGRRNGSQSPSSSRQSSRTRDGYPGDHEGGTTYAAGYHQAHYDDHRRESGQHSPYSPNRSPNRSFSRDRTRGGYGGVRDASPHHVMGGALRSPYVDEDHESRMPLSSDMGGMARSPVVPLTPSTAGMPSPRLPRTGGHAGDSGYTSYDEFRRGRRM